MGEHVAWDDVSEFGLKQCLCEDVMAQPQGESGDTGERAIECIDGWPRTVVNCSHKRELAEAGAAGTEEVEEDFQVGAKYRFAPFRTRTQGRTRNNVVQDERVEFRSEDQRDEVRDVVNVSYPKEP
jgi:hypothetical protein